MDDRMDLLDELLLRAVAEGRIDVETAAAIGDHADRLMAAQPADAEEFPL